MTSTDKKVEWVVQLDCPEDPATYIHRSGRTARYNKGGCALLVLLPSEKKMIEKLEAQKIPVKVLNVNPAKQQSITPQLTQLCKENPELKKLGEKAFVTYVRSIWMQKDKEVFDVQALPVEAFARSMGLEEMPPVKFLKGAKEAKNAPKKFEKLAKQLEGEMGPKKPKKKLGIKKKSEEDEAEDSENEDSQEESEGESDSDESDEESGEENASTKRREESSDSESEEEESEEEEEEEEEEDEEEGPRRKKAKQTSRSLKEEEEMALRILEQRKLK